MAVTPQTVLYQPLSAIARFTESVAWVGRNISDTFTTATAPTYRVGAHKNLFADGSRLGSISAHAKATTEYSRNLPIATVARRLKLLATAVDQNSSQQTLVQASTQYTLSAYLKADGVVNTRLAYALVNTSGVEGAKTYLTHGTTAWTRVSATVTTAADTKYLKLYFDCAGAGTGLWAGVQIEAGASATAFADNPYGNVGLFLTSPQKLSETAADLIDPKKGTLLFRARSSDAVNVWNSLTARYLFVADDGTNAFQAFINASNNLQVGWAKSGGADYRASASVAALAQGSWHHFAFTWQDGQATKLYINNALVGTAGTNLAPLALPTTLYIGANSAGASPAEAYIQDIVVAKYALTATEISALYNLTHAPSLTFLDRKAYQILQAGVAQNIMEL